jgi:hypothetical protein
MGRPCSTNRETRNVYRILVGKAEGKRQLGSPGHRWEDNIEMDLREIVWIGAGLIWLKTGVSGELL